MIKRTDQYMWSLKDPAKYMHNLYNPKPPITTTVPYANSLDLNETPSNSASRPDLSCLTPELYFHKLRKTMKHLENGRI